MNVFWFFFGKKNRSLVKAKQVLLFWKKEAKNFRQKSCNT
jgi:hypothetical protein